MLRGGDDPVVNLKQRIPNGRGSYRTPETMGPRRNPNNQMSVQQWSLEFQKEILDTFSKVKFY